MVGVDLYGQIAPFDQLREVVGDDVVLIEDAAQSQGADRHGRAGGSFGAVAATSFYPGKNLGAFGDAGAVTTDDAAIADRVRALRNHGGVERYQHLCVGTNSRLDSLQAAVLSIKLERLKAWNAERALPRPCTRAPERASRGSPADVRDGNLHVWHLYVVQVPRASDRGCCNGRRRHRDWRPLPDSGAPASGVRPPRAAELVRRPWRSGSPRRSLSLPMYPGITVEQQVAVVDSLARALRSA